MWERLLKLQVLGLEPELVPEAVLLRFLRARNFDAVRASRVLMRHLVRLASTPGPAPPCKLPCKSSRGPARRSRACLAWLTCRRIDVFMLMLRWQGAERIFAFCRSSKRPGVRCEVCVVGLLYRTRLTLKRPTPDTHCGGVLPVGIGAGRLVWERIALAGDVSSDA